MKRRPMMDDPELERVFTDVYEDTMRRVDELERDKEFSDHVEAYTELFERELSGRDLSDQERRAMTLAFERRIRDAESIKERRIAERRERRVRIGTMIGSTVAVLALVLILTYRPFTPIDRVRTDLDTYIERVEAGTGGYAEDFFKTLDRFDRRLPDQIVESYREQMRTILDERFAELLNRVRQGELTLRDDARDWANLFPDRADRRARKELVDNAVASGVGGKVQGLIENLKKAGEDAVEWVERQIEETQGDTASPD